MICAPHETMWLTKERPWEVDLTDLIERMEGRLTRISRNRFEGFEQALDDASLLVAALKVIRR